MNANKYMVTSLLAYLNIQPRRNHILNNWCHMISFLPLNEASILDNKSLNSLLYG